MPNIIENIAEQIRDSLIKEITIFGHKIKIIQSNSIPKDAIFMGYVCGVDVAIKDSKPVVLLKFKTKDSVTLVNIGVNNDTN